MKKLLSRKNIIFVCVLMMFINLFFCSYIDAASNTDVDSMWKSATQWFKNVDSNNNSQEATDIINGFVGIVNVIGTTVIVIATIFLGIKYIFGSVDSKADVKESMITLLIACVFFFGWTNISKILFPGNKFILVDTVHDESYKDLVGRVFNIVIYVFNIMALLGVIYVGVRYLFSGASGRADLKAKTPFFIIGIILSFATVSFLTFLSDSINQIISK